MYRSYLLKIALFFLPGICVLLLNYVFLLKTGELLSLQQLTEKQQESGNSCIYGTAVHDDTFHYKIEGYAYRKPDVVVLGSSRVMQFRENFFKSSFYNFGGSMSSINQGEQLIRQMTERHTPKLILLGIDFWWFNDKFSSVKYQEHSLPPKPRLRPEYLFDPISFLFHGKIPVSQYIRILSQPLTLSADGLCTIGISANFTGVGYSPDGSYNYGERLSGKVSEDTDVGFADTINLIENEGQRFEYGEHVNAEHLAHILSLVRSLQEQGIQVALFFPPLAPAAYQEMNRHRDHYGYLSELRQSLHQAGLEFYDFEDPSSVSTTNCEFIDGFHGGDITNARLLLSMARQNAHVRAFADIPALKKMILYDQGRASIANNRVTKEDETDFLKIGCKK